MVAATNSVSNTTTTMRRTNSRREDEDEEEKKNDDDWDAYHQRNRQREEREEETSIGLQQDINTHVPTALHINALSSEFQQIHSAIRSTNQQVQMLQQTVTNLQHQILTRNEVSSNKKETTATTTTTPQPLWTTVRTSWNQFFHKCIDYEQGVVLASYMRLGYGILIVYDKLLLSLDLDLFINLTIKNEKTMIPPPLKSSWNTTTTLLEWFFMSNTTSSFVVVLWFLHYVGLYCAIMFLFGIYPRFHVIGIILSQIIFQQLYYANSNDALIFNEQDDNNRIFLFYLFHLLWLPIHQQFTLPGSLQNIFLYCVWGGTKNQKSLPPSSSPLVHSKEICPIWPFRLIQIQICCSTLCGFIIKWVTLSPQEQQQWINGTALFYIIHDNDFAGKWLINNLDQFSLFRYMIVIKVCTWFFLVVQILAPILIWKTSTRKLAFYSIILVHLGIEICFNRHGLEWLTILAWCSFLVL